MLSAKAATHVTAALKSDENIICTRGEGRRRKSAPICCIDKWEIFDQHNKFDEGNAKYMEFFRLKHFEMLCEAHDVDTIWQACNKWPRLFQFFPEAEFEKKCRQALKKGEEKRRVTYPSLRRRGLPDVIIDVIIAFSMPTIGNRIKGGSMAQHLHLHDCEEADCYLLSQLEQDDDSDQDNQDEQDNESPYYSSSSPCQACIHSPMGRFWFVYQKEQEYDTLDHFAWENRIFANSTNRKILQMLLSEMGFASVAEAEKAFPFLICRATETFLELKNGFDEEQLPIYEPDAALRAAYKKHGQRYHNNVEYGFSNWSGARAWEREHHNLIVRLKREKRELDGDY